MVASWAFLCHLASIGVCFSHTKMAVNIDDQTGSQHCQK